MSTLPKLRLYRLNRGLVWYVDTKRPDGRRWQFSTHEEDESRARAFAVAKVAREFGEGFENPDSTAGSSASGATDGTGEQSRPSVAGGLAEKIRAARAGNAAPGGDGGASSVVHGETVNDDTADAPPPTPEGEMLADVIAMAGTLGLQSAVARAIRRRRWKESGKSGHFEPGAPNEKCVETLQIKLRAKALELFGTVGLDGWFGVGVFAAGVGISMAWNAEPTEDDQDAETARAAAGRPAESGAHETPAESPGPEIHGAPTGNGSRGGVRVTDLSLFRRE